MKHWFLIISFFFHCLPDLFSTHKNIRLHILTWGCTCTVHHRDFTTPLPKKNISPSCSENSRGHQNRESSSFCVIFKEFLHLWEQSGIWARGVDGFHLFMYPPLEVSKLTGRQQGNDQSPFFSTFPFGPHTCQLICYHWGKTGAF